MGLESLRDHVAALVLGTSIAAKALPIEAADGFATGRCVVARQTVGGAIRPTYAAGSYLFEYHGKELRYKDFSFEGAKVTLVKAPKHGKVVYTDDPIAVSSSRYTYSPKEGYEGHDPFVMDVEKNGVKVRIHYLIEVLPDWEPALGYCEKGQWKISAASAPSLPSNLATLLADAIGKL